MVKLFFGLFAIFFLSHTSTAVASVCELDEPCAVTYKTIGCYKDSEYDRVLPNYIYNERDSTLDNYGGREIDWYNWENYLAGFSCRCAAKAQELGYDLFGVQLYGECWAANANDVSISSLSNVGAKCVGDGYQPCGGNDRYCAGEEFTNFIYQIVNSTCPVEFVKEGCYTDKHKVNARPLVNNVMNDRDSTATGYSGQTIDWRNWDIYVGEFACRCAQKALQNGSTYFGLQYYGECWTHPNGGDTYGRDGSATDCIDNCHNPCHQDQFCMGAQFSNYVYRIKGQEACDANIEPNGCYVENPISRVLQLELVNANHPSPASTFYGKMMNPGNWAGFFTDFLCKCASEAKIKGQQYFGVSSNGICYTDNISTNYANLGSSSQCYEGNANRACVAGSKACAGINPTSSYVYKIPL